MHSFNSSSFFALFLHTLPIHLPIFLAVGLHTLSTTPGIMGINSKSVQQCTFCLPQQGPTLLCGLLDNDLGFVALAKFAELYSR